MRCKLILFCGLLFAGRVASGSDSVDVATMMTELQREAAPHWSAAINRLFNDDLAVSGEWTEDDSVSQVFWQNHGTHGCRSLTISSQRFEHVFATNPEYAFDITRKTNGQYAVRDVTSVGEVPSTASGLEMLVPSWTFFGLPLMSILDKSLFEVDSVSRVEGAQVRLELHVVRDFLIERPPYVYFRHDGRAGTKYTLWLDPARSWQLMKGISTGPGPGMEWEQVVTVSPSGSVKATVTAKLGEEIQRRYSHAAKDSVLPRFEEEKFYLPHYGLSESTADFLMGSRQYILVFCALFFGAIFFRILAYVLKRKRTKHSEATS